MDDYRSASSMHRNASAPSFAATAPTRSAMAGGGVFDPFADFLASTPAPAAGEWDFNYGYRVCKFVSLFLILFTQTRSS